MKIKNLHIIYVITLILILINQNCFSQKNNTIDSAFVNYTKLYQEVVYTHLNKTTYINGESIGFTSYVIDKGNYKLSNITKNLYCVITDKNNKIVKKKLIKVEDGIASNVFNVDSLFSNGNYVFKTYTNWMRNFKQQNYFQQQFKVINADKNKFVEKTKTNLKLDLQFLPEGGHLVNNVRTTVGLIAKDSLGNGVANVSGKIIDSNDNIVSSFTLNELGIGRFSFLPKAHLSYSAVGLNNGKEFIAVIKNKIKPTGIALKINRVREQVYISLSTNKETINNLKNKTFIVANYNSSKLSKLLFNFSNNLTITKKLSLKNNFSGLNIFTLFDQDQNPIAERLFFNYNGITLLKSSIASKPEKIKDSLTVKLKFANYKSLGVNNVSVSILPIQTKSYSKNNNIISQFLIQPFIKGKIEKAGHYFNNIDERKKYDLDNLLLTQGWSSYNWSNLFNEEYSTNQVFEKGIDIKLNFKESNKKSKLYIHSTSYKAAQIIDIEENLSSFLSFEYFPKTGENLNISRLDKKGKLTPASIYLQFKPNQVPFLESDNLGLFNNTNYYTKEEFISGNFYKNSLNNTQELKEIILKLNKKKDRIEKIKKKAYGKVYFFDGNEKYKSLSIFEFLMTKGFIIETTSTLDLVIKNRTNFSVNGIISPVLFIDGIQMTTADQLNWLNSNDIDYIQINKGGMSEGVRGGSGTIRIVTKTHEHYTKNYDSTNKIKFPLTFSKNRKFYTPIYQDYKSKFYRSYGTIDWLPKNTIDKKGILNLKFKNKQSNSIKLFMEGFTDDGAFIFEEKVIELKK